MFKVGDRVKFRGKEYPENCKEGATGTVLSVSVDTIRVSSDVSHDPKYGWNFIGTKMLEDIVPLTNAINEPQDFVPVVGDRVKYVGRALTSFHSGEEVTVESFIGDCVTTMSVVGNGRSSINRLWFTNSKNTTPQFVKIVELGASRLSEIPPEYVEVTNSGFYCSSVSNRPAPNEGQIYKVSSRKPQGAHIKKVVLDFEGGYIEMGCNKHEELFKPSTKSAYDKQNDASCQYQIGDYIVIIDGGWNNTSHKWSKKTYDVGEVYKITNIDTQAKYGYSKYTYQLDNEIAAGDQAFRKATPSEIASVSKGSSEDFLNVDSTLNFDANNLRFPRASSSSYGLMSDAVGNGGSNQSWSKAWDLMEKVIYDNMEKSIGAPVIYGTGGDNWDTEKVFKTFKERGILFSTSPKPSSKIDVKLQKAIIFKTKRK